MADSYLSLTYNERMRPNQHGSEPDDSQATQQQLRKEKGKENTQLLLQSQYSTPMGPQFGSTEYVAPDVRVPRLLHTPTNLSRSQSAPKPAKIQRDYSSDREAGDVMSEVCKELEAVMKRGDKDEKAYVCYEDLKNIWAKRSRVAKLIRLSSPSSEQIDFVHKNMIKILSTLVWIGDSKCLSQFRSRFFAPMTSCNAMFTDKNMPFLNKSDIRFIDMEPFKKHFDREQFRFTPVEIDIYEDRQKTQSIDPRQRLPFEDIKKGVGSGGFGKVDRVAISPKYYHHYGSGDEKADMISNKVYVVACKKIKLQKDFDKEKENLQILKESMTKHVRIMLHLTTIEHGLRRYILLPYAQYGDLEVFLHGGIAPGNVPKYNFEQVFRLGDRDMIVPLLAECLKLADALKWLHNQISIERTSDKVFCAHMDLKPANILIHPPDYKSVVGKWMISDFGISVFREDTEQQDPEYGSIGDYISQVTMNTRPKRQEGTYQAPEVKIAKKFEKASHLTADQQGIGRKSDVWSFGCILSEILAFSQGKAEMIKEFSDARKKQNAKDDYFYIERSFAPRFLAAADQTQNLPKSYEVRPTVLTWLDELCERVANPQKWMYCFVSTIKKILVVDTQERPNAKQLHGLLQHVQNHVRHSLDGKQFDCRVLNPRAGPESTIGSEEGSIHSAKALETRLESSNIRANNNDSDVAADSQVNDYPPLTDQDFRFFRQDTFGEELIDSVQRTKPLPHMESVEEIELEPATSSSIDPLTETEAPKSIPEQTSDDLIRPDPHPVQPLPGQIDGEYNNHRSSHFASFARPAHAHGIMIDRNSSPSVEAPHHISLPHPTGGSLKIASLALAISRDGPRLACLSRHCVYIYNLKVGNFSATFEPGISLPDSHGWKDLSIAGDSLVVWGYDSIHSRKLLYFCNTTSRKSRSFSAEQTGMLEKAAVSAQGLVALLCRKHIYVATLDSSQEAIKLSADAKYDQNFIHAAFNDTGDLLFAWAYGKVDKLYCWRCKDGVLQRATESESPYETDRRGKPDLIKVIPYNSYQGCIVAKPDRNLFPAQIRATLRDNWTPFPRNESQIPELQSACMFNDYSLITLEKGMRHRRLKEYQINYQGTHVLVTPPTEICGKLKTSTDDSSKLLAIKHENDVVIIVCNKNATVEFVKVVPARSMPVR